MGQLQAARKTLLEARSAAENIGLRRMLWSILFALSRIEDDPIEAKRFYRQAQEIVKYVANHIGDPELQASFLDLVEVQEVLLK